MHGSISQNGNFIQMMRHHPRNLGSEFQLNRLNHFDAWRDYGFYTLLYKRNYGYHKAKKKKKKYVLASLGQIP